MKASSFSRWLRQVARLTRHRRARLLDTLRPAVGLDQVCAGIGRVAPGSCPACQATRPYRHGYDRGLQRYRPPCAQAGRRRQPARLARDRTGNTVDAVTGRAAVTARQLHRHLLPKLDRDVLLVTDGHLAYRAFAREAGLSHESV